jgi:uncharacterized membrane protein YebE (DUF533 family)
MKEWVVLLIWGFKVRSKVLEEGHFFCPQEGGDRTYRRMQARRWFTFFFIPIIPLKVLGEYIECTACGATYEPRVLEMATTAQLEDQLTRAVRHVVVAMLHADAEISPQERQTAVDVVTRFGHTDYDVADLERDLQDLNVADLEHELTAVAGMLSPQGQEAVLRASLMLAAADGHVHDRELDAIMHAGRHLGMSPAHVRGVLAEVTETEAQPPA